MREPNAKLLNAAAGRHRAFEGSDRTTGVFGVLRRGPGTGGAAVVTDRRGPAPTRPQSPACTGLLTRKRVPAPTPAGREKRNQCSDTDHKHADDGEGDASKVVQQLFHHGASQSGGEETGRAARHNERYRRAARPCTASCKHHSPLRRDAERAVTLPCAGLRSRTGQRDAGLRARPRRSRQRRASGCARR